VTPRYAFIGGLHRSGTSLVTRCLAEHSAVTSFAHTGVWEDEGQHLQDVLLPARLMGGPGRFARHPSARCETVSDERAQWLRASLLAAWGPLWRADAEVRVAKSPPNLLRGRLLAQLFPESVLIVVRRHPLAVSLATRAMARRFRSFGLVDLVEHWVIAHETLADQAASLPNLRFVEHGTLVSGGHATLDPVFTSLGLTRKSSTIVLTDTDAKYRAEFGELRSSLGAKDPLWAGLADLSARVERLGYNLRGFERESNPTGPPFPVR